MIGRLTLGESIPVIPDLFSITLVLNPGAAFGLFSDWPERTRTIALAAVSIVALVIVLRLLIVEAKGDRYSHIALVSILAGAIGNVIDRTRLGAVIDFLDFYWGSYHWPAFNVADSAISLGVVTLLLRMVGTKKAEQDDYTGGEAYE